jgi:hypothetical protein
LSFSQSLLLSLYGKEKNKEEKVIVDYLIALDWEIVVETVALDFEGIVRLCSEIELESLLVASK